MMSNSNMWLLIGPSIALLYDLTVYLFLLAFGEISWDSKTFDLLKRTALLGAWIASTNNSPFLISLSLITSTYFIIQTRRSIAGPVPVFEDSSSQVILVTGANTGIGKETVRQLAARGATVILACRNESKARQAMRDIQASLPPPLKENQLLFLQCDLSSFQSVRQAVTDFEKMNLKLNVLINNAGVMFSEKHVSQDGYEMCLQANHLGHFLLTRLLLLQTQSNNIRIINLTSITYKMATGGFDFDDYNCDTKPYTLFGQYAQSKVANILFVQELARRGHESYAVNPGIVRTDVTRNMSPLLKYSNMIFGFLVQLYQKTPVQGAYTSVWAATSSTSSLIENGSFLSNSQAEETTEYVKSNEEATRLWELSETLVGWRNSK